MYMHRKEMNLPQNNFMCVSKFETRIGFEVIFVVMTTYMLVLFGTSMRMILNSISPMPPIGTRSLPVANNSNFFFKSSENDRTTSQKYLRKQQDFHLIVPVLPTVSTIWTSTEVFVSVDIL